MNWPFQHYVMAFFIFLCDIIGSEIYFDMSIAIPTFFWLVPGWYICFQPFLWTFCIFIFKMHVLGSQQCWDLLFLSSSLTICPLIVTLKPFLFYVNVAVLDLSLPCCYVWSVEFTWSPFSFPLIFCLSTFRTLENGRFIYFVFLCVVVLCERINPLRYYMLTRSRSRSLWATTSPSHVNTRLTFIPGVKCLSQVREDLNQGCLAPPWVIASLSRNEWRSHFTIKVLAQPLPNLILTRATWDK